MSDKEKVVVLDEELMGATQKQPSENEQKEKLEALAAQQKKEQELLEEAQRGQ